MGVAELLQQLKSSNVINRRKAAEALKHFSVTPQISKALRDVLNDPDTNVRANAAISLWIIEGHGQNVRRTLNQMLYDETTQVGRQSKYVQDVINGLLNRP